MPPSLREAAAKLTERAAPMPPSLREVAAAPPLTEGVRRINKFEIRKDRVRRPVFSYALPPFRAEPRSDEELFLTGRSLSKEREPQTGRFMPSCLYEKEPPPGSPSRCQYSTSECAIPCHPAPTQPLMLTTWTTGTTGTAFFQKHLNTPVYRIYPVLYALI